MVGDCLGVTRRGGIRLVLLLLGQLRLVGLLDLGVLELIAKGRQIGELGVDL